MNWEVGCSHVIAVANHVAQGDMKRVYVWATEGDAKRQRNVVTNIGDGLWLTAKRRMA